MSNALALLLVVAGGLAIYSGIKGVPVQQLLDGALSIGRPQSSPAPAPSSGGAG